MKIKQSVAARLEQSATVADLAYERKQRELWAVEAEIDAEEEFIQQALSFSPAGRECLKVEWREIIAQNRRAGFTLVP